MRYTAKASVDYILAGTGDMCQRLNIQLTPVAGRAHTIVDGNIFALISFFTALASHYRLSLREIREKFA